MNLPKRNERHSFKFKLSNNEIVNYVPWLVKDEQEYLYATEGNNDRDFKIEHIEELLSKCVQLDFGEITETDFYRLAIEIRKVSKGSEHEIIFTCPHCKTPNDNRFIDLNTDVKYTEFSKIPFEINDISIKFKEIKRKDLNALDQYTAKAEGRFMYIVYSIESIAVKDKVYANLSPEDIKTFLEEELTSVEFKALSEDFITKTADLSVAKVLTCDNCKKETSVFVEDIVDFFG